MDYFILLIILNDNFDETKNIRELNILDETNDIYDNDPSALVNITMYELLLLKNIGNMLIFYAFSLKTKYHFLEISNIQRQDAEHYFTGGDIHIKKRHVIFVRYYSSVPNERGVLTSWGKGLENKLSERVGMKEGLDFSTLVQIP